MCENNYGTICVTVHPGLSEDQLASTVKMAVENQLLTSKREHYNEILNQCIGIAKLCIPPLKVNWDMREYKYNYHLGIVSDGNDSSGSS
jgi:hypothetical protein